MTLREWLEEAQKFREVEEFEGAHWNLEIGAIADLVYRKSTGIKPCLRFKKIPGYPEEFSVLIGALGSPRRLALTLGLDWKGNMMTLVKDVRRLIGAAKPLAPELVTSIPVMENIQTGEEIDVTKFPAPFHHELDGGRYLGTADLVITRDGDSGMVNLGTYRIMVHDEKTLGLHILPGKHGAIHRDKAWEQKEPFPVAVVLGPDPLLYLVSCMEIPYGVCEYDYAGGLRSQSIPVFQSDITGLPLPAEAEIIVEGICYPGEKRLEGPFGEWCGYYANNGLNPVEEPVIHVKRVLYRNNPILTAAQPGRGDETNFQRVIVRSALIWDELEKAGIPDVQGVWCNEAGASRFLTVVSIKQRYGGHARQAGAVATQCHAGAFNGRYVIVVDEDIDPSNTFDVLWAISTRSDPATDIEILRRCWSSSADPMMHPDIPANEKRFNTRAIIDACRPFEWKDRFPPVAQTSQELEDKIYQRFPRVKTLLNDGKNKQFRLTD